MGVKGLTTFVDDNQHLLSAVRLHDTRVILDGNNIYHFIYYYFQLSLRYGGDYEAYADRVRYFFRTFQACGIEPFVIFDGGIDTDEKKLETCMQRTRDRVRAACGLVLGKRGRVLPILAYETFRSVMSELNIQHAMCDYEADSEMAALAQEWECPVISNDSDFFIYDLKAGCIVLDYLNLQIKTHKPNDSDNKTYKYLSVQVYHLDKFLGEINSTDKRQAALLATLLGNDYVEADVFEAFFYQAQLPKPTSERFTSCVRFKRIIRVLLWLQETRSFDKALDEILLYFQKGRKVTMERLIMQSVNSYCDLKSSLGSYFKNLRKNNNIETESVLKTYTGDHLPEWFLSAVRGANLPRMSINITVHHREMLMSQAEMVRHPSSYMCSRKLRSIMYCILFTAEKSSVTGKAERRAKIVQEYDRIGSAVKCYTVDPLCQLTSGLGVPSLHDMPLMSSEDRITFFLEALGIKNKQLLLCLPEDAIIFSASVIYWMQNALPSVTVYHMVSLITSFIKLSVIDVLYPAGGQKALIAIDKKEEHKASKNNVSGCKNKEASYMSLLRDSSTDCEEIQKSHTKQTMSESQSKIITRNLHGAYSKAEFKSAVRMLNNLGSTAQQGNTDALMSENIHAVSQFQTCLQAALFLNQILCYPLYHCSPANIISGSTLYNVNRELSIRRDPISYVTNHILGHGTALSLYCREIYTAISDNIPKEMFLPTGPGKKNNKKHKSKKLKKKKHKIQNGVCDDSDDDTAATVTDLGLDINCSVSNMFSNLSANA